MRTSIATVCLSGDFQEKLDAIAAAGFNGVEIFENDFLTYDASPAEVGRMVRDRGLAITLFQPFRDFEGFPEPYRSRAFDRAARKFDVMNQMGADLVLVCSNTSPASLGGIDRAAADFAELGALGKKHGIRIGYEALAWGRHINDHRDAWEIVRRADHPNVGLILDSFHTLSRGIDPNSIRSIPGDKIFIVQLADAPRIDMDLLFWSRHFRNMPGEGDLPVLDFTRAVAATGYDGPWSLEIFNDQFRGGDTRMIATDGQRSLVALLDDVGRMEPGLKIALPAMPERIDVKGVEFIEFATGGAESEELIALLKRLGFSEVGAHISKSVRHFRQGAINLVVNTDADGVAHSNYIAHGTCAYAIGLLVEDAKDTVARAKVLGATPFQQAVGPMELEIPAIRGVGGGLIYFLDKKEPLANVWSVEFEPVADETSPYIGLAAVDHVAETMDHGEMLSWVLFFTSIFSMTKSPTVDVVDPAGLVRSQVLEASNGAFRLTLNGAENRNTLAGRFIATGFGSSIQHVAFRTDDIFATAEALERNGLALLPITRNYFDDIEARFGLEPEFVDRLIAHNILYDRDENGEYFQLYTNLFGAGFFFEIVERRGRYSGYGAPNAPFRIAAQKRGLPDKAVPRL
ncbi:bifunctional sugar phosphate isomerase/epimerase/4-hydroxyphenylpyruvate dioxygenase family protein [Pelagibacterium xiamenense]|uniref:bifunctional sugar phosphate isomerase/epimerase/4-hydroxyphenylpyruvate dioxygenase family protein n=1 Tax=Pelagibacterium xiamenense TaxID=2901140 RepID=UPI001E2C5BE9|nr:sugar phosphate isomerase/epimerase and 4-hydroxyphenylpyruvate domain-containing protein [Pelagibacterium xiamenense]